MDEKLLNIKKAKKKKKPKFKRQEINHKKALKDAWRKPRGINSKKRIQLKSKGRIPKPGYGTPKELRGTNNHGNKLILVSNLKELGALEASDVAIIAHSVGKKKRLELLELAEKKSIKISNAKY